jgi:uncharacterized protein YdeI (YjbR/CyaY-like superfamily)
MNPKVDFYFKKAGPWQEEVEQLRAIVLSCGLDEELKWGSPCYMSEKKNVVLIHTFKEYCALLFFKGALLKDPRGILVQQSENVQAARQIRFTDVNEIIKKQRVLKAYIQNAIEVEKAGLKVALRKTTEYSIPDELRRMFEKNQGLRKAFYALTPGRQRGYLLHFSSAKQSKTREARIEKNIPRILEGYGLDD